LKTNAKKKLSKEGKYSYYEVEKETPIVILHGPSGGLSNFDWLPLFF
jgi:hypothetical protein